MVRRLRAILLAFVVLVAAIAAVAVIGRIVGGGPQFPLPSTLPPKPAYVKPLGAAVRLDAALADTVYRDDFLSTFSSLTPENAMKWEVVHPSPGRWDFEEADALVDMAAKTGRRVRGHPLVWDQQIPDWVGKGDVESTLRGHVTKLATRYRGRVAQWDVVNEPLEDDGAMTASVWQKALGERYIDIAFRAARAADPKARLFLNEIAAERGRKFRALIALVTRLKERGVPIDGIGLQNHTTSKGFPSRDVLAGDFADIRGLGLDVEITEMDVVGGDPRAFAAASAACEAAENCTGLTVWGVTDRWSWIGADKTALPFDASGKPKPALEALRRPLVG